MAIECLHAQRELWAISVKLVLILTEEDIEKMLEAKSTEANPEAYIKEKIEDFRLFI